MLNVKGMVVEDVSVDDSPVASRSRAGGPAAVPEGGTQVFALRAQVPLSAYG
ncbi:MAG: hypothetical protein ACLVEF_07785 [Bifidobacterium bifidum]